jgi:hypothetical protein
MRALCQRRDKMLSIHCALKKQTLQTSRHCSTELIDFATATNNMSRADVTSHRSYQGYHISFRNLPPSTETEATKLFTYLLTYLLTYSLTPWCRILFEKLATELLDNYK